MKRICAFIIIASIAVAQTACSNSGPASRQNSSRFPQVSAPGSDETESPLPELPPEPTPSPTPTQAGGTAPLYTFRVGTIGYNSVSVKVVTHSRLRVKFTPGSQDESVPGTNFSPYYSAMGVFIAVGDRESPTALTPVETDSFIIDFSKAGLTACTSDEPSCRQEVTVTVKKPNYDYWCVNYAMYCPYTHVYDTHPWHGTLTVETDDTEVLTRN
jgi:hypothetical protein